MIVTTPCQIVLLLFAAAILKVALATTFEEGRIKVEDDASPLQPNKEGRSLNTCQDADFSIVDQGYEDSYRGWYDATGCGSCNHYCRWVGNSGPGGDPSQIGGNLAHGSSWWSCQTGDAARDDIYTRWDSIDDQFHYAKCSGKNARPPTHYSQERTGGLTPYENYVFLHQEMIIGGWVEPGKYKIVHTQLIITSNLNMHDLPWIALERPNSISHPRLTSTMCQAINGNEAKCGPGDVAFADADDTANYYYKGRDPQRVEPINALSRFSGEDPAGTWRLHLAGGRPGRISSWSLYFEIEEVGTGIRRMLRADGGRDK